MDGSARGQRFWYSHACRRVRYPPQIVIRYQANVQVNDRIVRIVCILAFTGLSIVYWRVIYRNYWILKDGVQSTGIVTEVDRGAAIHYRYVVRETTYFGYGRREYRNHMDIEVGVDGNSVVWYSSSHPWLSVANRPTTVLFALPWIVIVMGLDLLCIVGLVKSWATPSSSKARPRRSLRSGA